MITVLPDTRVRVPVLLADSGTSLPVTGVAAGAVEVGILKADGAYSSYVPDVADWAEITTGPALGGGLYQLHLLETASDVEGPLSYVVKSAASKAYVGTVAVQGVKSYATFLANGETEGPAVVQISSPSRTKLRVTFSEAVLMTAGPSGALNPANYTVPGLTISLVSEVTAQQVVLTTSQQAPNQAYTLTVANVVDLSGNVIA